ncbi:hypothetical protein THTE_2596 [Thermogutta terrifontis]|uniref:Uncharacterized protein n=1 Tax=Thermogutta terrifontis TaxID=1331910 RepID=A0A286RGW4_9BACT|nr:hypothetical protein THTE_2596 [Thermogutta terrifontis]
MGFTWFGCHRPDPVSFFPSPRGIRTLISSAKITLAMDARNCYIPHCANPA